MALLEAQILSREPDLVPVRHGRMMVSPFTFYRGAAKIMAADLKDTLTAGLENRHLTSAGNPHRRAPSWSRWAGQSRNIIVASVDRVARAQGRLPQPCDAGGVDSLASRGSQ